METGGNRIFCLLSEKSLLCLSQLKVLKSPSEIAHLICLQNPFTHNPERILQESFLNSQDPRGAVKVEGERFEAWEGSGFRLLAGSSCLSHLRRGGAQPSPGCLRKPGEGRRLVETGAGD